jgi:hypothetical protein
MAVPLSAALEYLCAELLELSGNACSCVFRHESAIKVVDIEVCVKEDEELAETFRSFSAHDVISFVDVDDPDLETIRRSKVVAEFVFGAAKTSSQDGPSFSFLETFLVEAACACASQTLSCTKVKALVKQLTSLCSDAAFQSFAQSSHCSLLIAALEWVSVCGSEVVVPFAADRDLAHLRLRLSSCVRALCQISDTRR